MTTNIQDNGTITEKVTISPQDAARRRFDAFLSEAMNRLDAAREDVLGCRELLKASLRDLLDARMAAVSHARTMGRYAGDIYESVESFTMQIMCFAATIESACCEVALQAGERAVDSAVEAEIAVMGPLQS